MINRLKTALRIWITVVVIDLLAIGNLQAQLPPFGYIFVFADGNHAEWCINGEGIYKFESWIWCVPSEGGCIGAEFLVVYPSNIQEDTLIVNEDIISNIEGDLASGVRVDLSECQYAWFWMLRQEFYVLDTEKSQIYISLNTDTSYTLLRTCETDNPGKPCCACSLFVNYDYRDEECSPFDQQICDCSTTETRNFSWGAIKSILK